MDKQQAHTPLNLATRKLITKAQTQALQELNQAFSRTFSLSLSAWLGANIQIGMVGAQRSLFSGVLEAVDVERTYFSLCRFSPVDASAMIAIDMNLIAPVIHLGLGGQGMPPDQETMRELTDIDVAIMDILMTRLCAEMNQLWAQCGLQSAFDQRILPATLGRIYPRTEDMLCLTYEMQIGNVEGTLQIALATAVSDLVLRELVRQDTKRVQSEATRELLRDRLSGMKIAGSLSTRSFKVSAEEILALKPGAVLNTGVPEGTDFVFSLGGKAAWTAGAVAIGSRRGAQLSERLGE